MGYKMEADQSLVIDEEKSIEEGAVDPYSTPKAVYYQNLLEGVCQHFKVSQTIPFKKNT